LTTASTPADSMVIDASTATAPAAAEEKIEISSDDLVAGEVKVGDEVGVEKEATSAESKGDQSLLSVAGRKMKYSDVSFSEGTATTLPESSLMKETTADQAEGEGAAESVQNTSTSITAVSPAVAVTVGVAAGTGASFVRPLPVLMDVRHPRVPKNKFRVPAVTWIMLDTK
jgi:hypothetical protein